VKIFRNRGLFLIAFCLQMPSGVFADQPAKTETAGNSFVDLTATELQTKNNMLDCGLRLEGSFSKYRLVFSRGSVRIPETAVARKDGQSHVLINVRAYIGRLKVEQLHVRLAEGRRNELLISCRKGASQCVAPVAYALVVRAPEEQALTSLQALMPRSLLSSGKYDIGSEANPGAILVFDRPDLVSPAMDGHSGAPDSNSTNLYYVCGTSIEYWQ